MRHLIIAGIVAVSSGLVPRLERPHLKVHRRRGTEGGSSEESEPATSLGDEEQQNCVSQKSVAKHKDVVAKDAPREGWVRHSSASR